MMSIPDKIRVLRAAKRVTQDDLAQRTGIPSYFISAIESGAIPRYERRLLEELGYSPSMDALLGELATVDSDSQPA
jgi:transcriptional regulator with XRE-family HTH domain